MLVSLFASSAPPEMVSRDAAVRPPRGMKQALSPCICREERISCYSSAVALELQASRV
jgi:hypothetical protein